MIDLIDPKEYDLVITRLREFFRNRGFIETPVQHRPSILAACEDPRTIATFSYAGDGWPLPQTGQMWLEIELLSKPESPGYYCISTSYRNEPHPIPGRHNLIFPMFEFETHGDMDALQKLETELLEYLGFGAKDTFHEGDYEEIAARYKTAELKDEHEKMISKDFGQVFFLKNFPLQTSPFWNMKRSGNYAKKIDVLLFGMETIGSAERSTDPDEMLKGFKTISDGMYADILFAQFTQERVEAELFKFLKLKFFPRCGGGIGITRMIRAMKLAKLI